MNELWNSVARAVSAAPEQLPRVSESGLNLEVLIFTAAIAILTSLLFGLVPALHASRVKLVASLSEGGRSGTDARESRKLKDLSVVTETVLAVVLLTPVDFWSTIALDAGAGFLLQSLQGLGKIDPGFPKDRVITFGLDLPGHYGHIARVQFYQRLPTGIRSLPGVRSASAAFPLPLSRLHAGRRLTDCGRRTVASSSTGQGQGLCFRLCVSVLHCTCVSLQAVRPQVT